MRVLLAYFEASSLRQTIAGCHREPEKSACTQFEWLKEDDAGLAGLASRLGYPSEAAFSRAFKRCIGTSLGAIRRSDVRTAPATS